MPNQLDLPPVYAVIAILAAIVFGWFGILISGYLGHGFWGVVLILIGIGLVGWSAWLFKEYQTTIIPRQQPDALVMDGPFLISRNPMYLGMVLITLGVGVFMGLSLPIFQLLLLRSF
ncbi:MAG: methyltransferase [Pseudomonadota bacterium]